MRQRILVLTEKGIEEEGTHEELLEKGGVYEKLYQMQFHAQESLEEKCMREVRSFMKSMQKFAKEEKLGKIERRETIV